MNMRLLPLVFLCLGVALEGCAATPRLRSLPGPAFDLPSDLARMAHIGRVDAEGTLQVVDRFAQTHSDYDFTTRDPLLPLETDPLRDLEFRDTIESAVMGTLKSCAQGEHRLDARIVIERLEYDPLASSLADGRGLDAMAGVVELIDPEAGGVVVARFKITVGTPSGNALSRLSATRTQQLANRFGAALCDEAFSIPAG